LFSKFKGVHASTGASVAGQEIVRARDHVQLLTAEELAARNRQREADAFKMGILYYPEYVDDFLIGLEWNNTNCLGPGGWLSDPVMSFYTKLLERGEDVTLGERAGKEFADKFMFLDTFVYSILRMGTSKEVRGLVFESLDF
jgi:Ulp1 family protease